MRRGIPKARGDRFYRRRKAKRKPAAASKVPAAIKPRLRGLRGEEAGAAGVGVSGSEVGETAGLRVEVGQGVRVGAGEGVAVKGRWTMISSPGWSRLLSCNPLSSNRSARSMPYTAAIVHRVCPGWTVWMMEPSEAGVDR